MFNLLRTKFSDEGRWLFVLAMVWGALTLAFPAAAELSSTPNPDTWVPNGRVDAIACSDDTVYLGGKFSYVGPLTGQGVPLDRATGEPLDTFPKVKGIVHASAPDGNGGWYIGGDFTQVGGIPRNRIAHIRGDGTLDMGWVPNANGTVTTLAVYGTRVFAGGEFTHIGGEARRYLAAIDTVTGDAIEWNPNPDDSVNTIYVSGDSIYVGGWFEEMNGEVYEHVAAFDGATGALKQWAPNADGPVYAFAQYENGPVYVGGWFLSIGGTDRNFLAAIDPTTGQATDWNPSPDGPVYALAVKYSNFSVIVGGWFDNIGGRARNNLAEMLVNSGSASFFECNTDGIVSTLAIAGPIIYAGGWFEIIEGQPRPHLAAITLQSSRGDVLPWNPNAQKVESSSLSAPVYTLSISGDAIYAGGDFTSIGGKTRNNLAALDIATGKATPWNPGANGQVIAALAVSDNSVYIGGGFTAIGGQPRSYLAATDDKLGAVTKWNPNPNSWIKGLHVADTKLYAWGNFTSLNGKSRNRIAQIDLQTSQVTDWNPNPTPPSGDSRPEIFDVVAFDSLVYVAGYFHTIGGESIKYLAALDDTTGSATSWFPSVDSSFPKAIAISNNIVYIAGGFFTIGNQYRYGIGAIDRQSGKLLDWYPQFGSSVEDVLLSDNTLYVSGYFTQIDGNERYRLASLDIQTGAVTDWQPTIIYEVTCMAKCQESFYIGGNFNIDGRSQFFARFDPKPVTPPNNVLCLTEYGEAWETALDQGALTTPSKWNALGFHHDAATGWQTVSGNFNGDELIDLLTVTDCGEAWIALNSGTQSFETPFKTASGYLFDETSGWTAIPGDFNGDGVIDLAQVTEFGDIWIGLNTGAAIPSPSLASYAGASFRPNNGFWMGSGDVTGNGGDDMIEAHPDGRVLIHAANGKGIDPPADWGDIDFQYDRGDGDNPGFGIVIGDFNDDGKDDLLNLKPEGDAWVALSNGSGFDAPTRWAYLGFKFAPRLNNGWDIFAGDMNGDGVDDLVQLTEYGEVWFASSDKSSFAEPVKLGATGFRSSPEGPWKAFVGRLE